MGRSRSAAQLQRQKSIPLPPIMKAPRPFTFEDMYSSARTRVAKKSAFERRGGTAPHLISGSGFLPDFPRGLVRLSAYLDPLPPEEPSMLAWAADALDNVPGEERQFKLEDQVGSRRASVERRSSVAPVGDPSGSSESGRPLKPGSPGGHQDGQEDMLRRDISEPMRPRASVVITPGADPDMLELLETIAARAEGAHEGFTFKEIERMEVAFSRFKIPGESDLYVTDVSDLLAYLGHVITKEDQVMSVVRQVTTYDYMDFDEYVTFMEKFVDFERQEFERIFYEFDEDGSGEISVKELRALTKALGFVPLRQMVDEALRIVDADGNGQLDFSELCTFLAVYQHAEGFTRLEVAELRKQFNFFAVDGEAPKQNIKVLPPEALSDAMVQVFGLQVTPLTRIMADKLSSGQGLQKSSFDKGAGEPESLHFPEFLIFARKLREELFGKTIAEHPSWAGHHLTKVEQQENAEDQTEFAKHDLDNSGGISEAELRNVLIGKQYTPLRCVLDEIFDEIFDGEWDPETSELDFEEFFDFLLVFEQRDGFSKTEAKDLRRTYDRFDEDGSGEVSAMECADLFRYVGYRVTLDDLRDHVSQVDENGSGQLDFREFLRLMRLYREKELKKIKAAFEQYKDMQTGTASKDQLDAMLRALGNNPPFPAVPGLGEDDVVGFDDVVTVVDLCRSAYVAKERKKAGFSDEEIENFMDIYNRFDLNKNGEIDNMELQYILKEFNWEPKSREQQTDLMNKLDVARSLAREAGCTDVGPDGSPFLKFWSFIQLARMLRTEKEKEEEAALRALQAELRFSEGEVEDFRQIFRTWVRKSYEIEGKKPPKKQENVPETLSRDMVRRLIRSLGVSVTPLSADQLDKQVQELDSEGRTERAELLFPAFLRLMRWVLDTDFAGINDAAAKTGGE